MTHVWTLGTALMSKDNAAMTGARSRVAHTIVRGGRKAHATRMWLFVIDFQPELQGLVRKIRFEYSLTRNIRMLEYEVFPYKTR